MKRHNSAPMGCQVSANEICFAPRMPSNSGQSVQVKDVLDSIRQIVRSLRVASRAAEKDVGLSSAQLLVLQRLARAKSMSLNDLADETQTHQSSTSVIV